jgi:hypothetical protein
MTEAAEEAVVRKAVHVKASIERAFSVFVEQMGRWWPASHHLGKTPFETIIIEPRAGGKWYERNAAGERCEWGTVLKWDPPHRATFSWHLGPGHGGPDWVMDPDPTKASEVEVRFTAEGPGATLVELIHSKLDRHGEGYEELRAIFERPTAWQGVLEFYAGSFELETANTAKEQQ